MRLQEGTKVQLVEVLDTDSQDSTKSPEAAKALHLQHNNRQPDTFDNSTARMQSQTRCTSRKVLCFEQYGRMCIMQKEKRKRATESTTRGSIRRYSGKLWPLLSFGGCCARLGVCVCLFCSLLCLFACPFSSRFEIRKGILSFRSFSFAQGGRAPRH